jgi:hypothetical protein
MIKNTQITLITQTILIPKKQVKVLPQSDSLFDGPCLDNRLKLEQN